MLKQHQAEISAQLEELLDSVCAGPLPVADRLKLRRLADALCHASKVTDKPLDEKSRVDTAVAALKRFKANLKRRSDARDRLTSKRLMDLPDDARSIDRCLDFIINGDGAMDTVRQKLSDLEHSKANILRLMEHVTPATKIEPHPNIGQLYQRRVEQLSYLLNDDSSQQEAVTIIRSLIDRIEITPGERRGDPQVQLVGGLAAILELAVSGQQKTAIQMDDGVGRVLLVAGAGFEPATFRL